MSFELDTSELSNQDAHSALGIAYVRTLALWARFDPGFEPNDRILADMRAIWRHLKGPQEERTYLGGMFHRKNEIPVQSQAVIDTLGTIALLQAKWQAEEPSPFVERSPHSDWHPDLPAGQFSQERAKGHHSATQD